MKTRFSLLMVLALLCSLVPLSTFGQDPPATKAAATTATALNIPPANDGIWHTLMTTTIKNPTGYDDFFIDVCLVKCLTTTVVDLTGPTRLSSAAAKLEVRVLVDGIAAQPGGPGGIVFEDKTLTLTQRLQTAIATSCTTVTTPVVDVDCVCQRLFPFPFIIVGGTPGCPFPPTPISFPTISRSCTTTVTPDVDQVCTIAPPGTPLWRELLRESEAKCFDFLAREVGGDGETHVIKAQARLTTGTSGGGTVQALLGPGSLKVEAVNLK